MKTVLAVSLLAAISALAQDQTPATQTNQQASQTQQQPQHAPEQQPATAPAQAPAQTQEQQPAAPQQPAQEQPAPQQPQLAPAQPPQIQPAPQQTQPTPPPQPKVAATNLAERFNGPTLSEVYCAGFMTRNALKPSGHVIAGSNAPQQISYSAGNYIYLQGDEIQEGKEYLLLRHTEDPNQFESYPGQLATLKKMGEMYTDLGRAKVLYMRNKMGVAQIESSCDHTLPGDIAVPFQERARPEFKHTDFNQFALPSGKTGGRIVMGKEFDTMIGARRVVYLNIGQAQGVKPGDYFRITREYSSMLENPTESLPFMATVYDDAQKNPPKIDLKRQINLPRRSVGELMALNATDNATTALITFAPEDIHLGDSVEMIDATPIPAPAEPVAPPPQPPTISCSVSRSTIQVGESSNITCNGVPEEGHTLAYSYQASAGQVAPRDSRATFTGTAPGPATITATAVDDRNLSAQTTVNVDVQAAPAAVTPGAATPSAPPTPTMLNELTFKPNSAYVDNRAKAVLDDDALRLQREASSNLMIEGSVNPNENDALAAQRAENAKTYLTRSKGIDASRIQTRAAASKTGAKASVVLIPAGANPQ